MRDESDYKLSCFVGLRNLAREIQMKWQRGYSALLSRERERERIFCNFIVLAAYHPLCLEYLDHVFTCESEISQLSEWSAAIKFVLCKYEPWCNWKPSAFALDTRHDRTIQKPENVRVFILIPAHFKSFKTYLNEWPFVACHTLSNKFFLHFRSGYSPKVLLSRFVFRDKGNTLC